MTVNNAATPPVAIDSPVVSSRAAGWHLRPTIFFVLLIFLLATLFEVMRLGLILRNVAGASGANGAQLVSSFFYGFRFDLAIACYAMLPVVIIGQLPVIGLEYSRRLRRIVFVLLIIATACMIFILLAEYEFFHEFQTRYNQLAFQYLDQPKIVAGMMWYNYPVLRYALICAMLTSGWGLGVYWLMRKCFGGVGRGMERDPKSARWVAEGAQMALLIGLMVVGMRGGVQAEPLRWGNAYHSSNEFVNQMSLNGLFALSQSAIDHFRHGHSSAWLRRMPADRGKEISRALVIAPSEELLDPAGSTVLRQALRRTDGTVSLRKGDRPPNVVLVLMESFSARFVGACGSTPDFTPEFDRLAANGVLFDHAFSGGTHTHQGVFCSMLGFPNLPGFEYLMENIVANQKFLALPTLLKQQGYQSMFLYNGNLAWDNMEGFFRKQGIDRFVGSPDYEHPIHRDRVWGVTDQDVFDRANREFEEADAKGPFFSLVLTLSNHVPFDLPEPLPFARTTEMGELNRRIDGIRYADWAVGHFIAEAKTLKYFQNTLFVFVGDHGFHVAPKLTEAHLLFHHVPLLFYSPLLSDKGKVISTAAAQMNILPTILGLLGVQPAQASWGRNLFSKEFADENFVVFKGSGGSGSDQAMVMIRGDKLMVVGSEGTPSIWKYRLNPTPSIEPLTDPASIVLRDRMQLEINAYVQSAMSDLTSQHGGGRTPVIQPVELLHEREDNDRDVPATRPAS